MRIAPPVEFTPEQDRARRLGRRLAWATLGYYCIDATLMYLVVGRSQAMKAAWLQDVFAVVPGVGFLLASYIADNKPNQRFPYGYHRVVSIAFFFAAMSLIGVGLYLVIDSLIPFVKLQHPTIGGVHVIGHTFWLGWLMLITLLFSSAIPPFFLGRAMIGPARTMHDKVLYSNADMQKAGWLSAGSAFVGVIAIGLGYWWADYIAALAIAFQILRDGYRNSREAIYCLMDEAPRTTDFRAADPVVTRVRKHLESLEWVESVELRMREEGHVFFGEALVVPSDWRALVEKIRRAVDEVLKLDWRVYDFVIMPVESLGETERPSDKVEEQDARVAP